MDKEKFLSETIQKYKEFIDTQQEEINKLKEELKYLRKGRDYEI